MSGSETAPSQEPTFAELVGTTETAAQAFRALFRHAPLALAALTLDGRIFAANPRLCRLLGISAPGDLVVDDVAPPEELDRLEALLARVGAGETLTAVGPLLVADGSRVTVRGTLMPVRTAAGDRTFSLAALEPDDEQSRLHAELHQSRAVVHDLKNLLMPLLHYAERLYEELPGGSVHHADAEQAQELARRAVAVARGSLRANDARTAGAVDVNSVLLSLRSIARLLLGAGVDIVVKPDPARPFVRLERADLERALENIAVNARDAMPDGGTFTVETEQRGDTVVIRCSDTGTGISSEDRDRVFEGGFTTKATGHGVGLESVRRFVESYGGTVAVESEPHTGTTFTLTLPRALDATGDDAGGSGRGSARS